MEHCVYILYSSKLDRYYIGRTENLELRLQFHNNPIEARKFTAKGIPWVLKLSIRCQSLVQATKLEQFIKRMKSRKFIESLVSDLNLKTEILKKVST